MDGAIEFIRAIMDDVALKIWRLFVALVMVVAVCVGSMLYTGTTTPFVCVLVVAVPPLVIEMRGMRVRYRKLRLLLFRVETDSLGSIAAASVGGPESLFHKSLDFKDHAMLAHEEKLSVVQVCVCVPMGSSYSHASMNSRMFTVTPLVSSTVLELIS